jgi:hypothetical protein
MKSGGLSHFMSLRQLERRMVPRGGSPELSSDNDLALANRRIRPFSRQRVTTELANLLLSEIRFPDAEPNHRPLPCEGRLPEVSRWKDTAGPGGECAYGDALFPMRAPTVVQMNRGALPMLRGRL